MKTSLEPGDRFTVAGIGYDKDGWLVFNRHRIDGKRSKAVSDHVWTVGESNPIDLAPAVLPPDAKSSPAMGKGPRNRWGAKR